jgi:O-antigen/teichoic acid export membrane protein
MANLDRLLLTQLIPLGRLTFYSAPMEMISRLWVVPGGVSRIFFPKFAATRNDQDLLASFKSAYLIMAIFMVPVVLVAFWFMNSILTLWISAEFAGESTMIAQIILVGVFVNSFNWITYGYLQSSSKVAWSIYTVFLELPLFLGFFYWATQHYGLLGAASVWSGRLILDFVLTHAVVGNFKRNLLPFFGIVHLFLVVFLALAFLLI